MAEYIGAGVTPTRRRAIIKEAQFPKTSMVAQYRGAREGLVKFLADGSRSPAHLARATASQTKRSAEAGSDWVKTDCRNSIEAIRAFEGAYNRLSVLKLDCRLPSGKSHQIDKWPSLISVAFDLTLHKSSGNGPDKFGAALFVFSRGEASSNARKERCSNIAGLIYTFCNQYLGGFGEADPALCLAIDVFTGTEYRCPGTFARKLRHVEDSCTEIATIWPTIPPPTDYDGPPLRRAA
jgi:hypothetical protein